MMQIQIPGVIPQFSKLLNDLLEFGTDACARARACMGSAQSTMGAEARVRRRNTSPQRQ